MNPRAEKLIDYISFKLDCLREQEENPLVIDMKKARENHDKLQALADAKVEILKRTMPKVPIISKKNKPKNMHKQDGTLSKHGEKWYEVLRSLGLPKDTEGPVEVVAGHDEPNPGSTPQVKDWLYSLGWKPETFKYVRDKSTGDERKIEQVRKDGELCPSVLKLKSKAPDIEHLEGLTILQHRVGILKSFLTHAKCDSNATSDESGAKECLTSEHKVYRVAATAGGFTNTLRLQHRVPIVNLPGVDKPWGQEIRECIVAPEGKVLCGADVSSLEDKTKRHYMWEHDPEYVKEMEQEGFDPHLDLAKHHGVITQEQIDKDRESLGPVRKKYKVTNYSATYNIQPPKLSRELSITRKEAKALLDGFWQRNWSIKKIAEETYVKTLKDGTKWLYNPLSGFYYNLRKEADRFSTLNQGTGVYVFDAWVLYTRKEGIKINMSYHDEILFECDPENKHTVSDRLHYAMGKVNQVLKLNVKIGIEEKYGNDYASVH